MAKSVPVFLVLSFACLHQCARLHLPAAMDSPGVQNTMSEAEAKHILAQSVISNLEEIGTKEVLREHGMEHISASDAQSIVTAAEGMVQEQMPGGNTMSDSDAQKILGKYNEKLMEIGASKVIEAEELQAEAKQILGEELLKGLEDIGAQEVLRKNEMQEISESDANIVAAASMDQELQMIGGKIGMKIGDELGAQRILNYYEEQLQNIGAEQVLSYAAAMTGDRQAQMIPSQPSLQAQQIAILHEKTVQKSEPLSVPEQVSKHPLKKMVQAQHPHKKMVHESIPWSNVVEERLLDKNMDSFVEEKLLDSKMAQNLGIEEIIGNSGYHFGSDLPKTISDFKSQNDHHQKVYHYEKQAERDADHQSQGAHAEGLFQQTKHHVAHMLHLDGNQAHADSMKMQAVSDDGKMVNGMLKDMGVSLPSNSIERTPLTGHANKRQTSTERMSTDVGANKVITTAMDTSRESNTLDHHGFEKKIADFGQIVHSIGSEKSKKLYLDLLHSITENQELVGSQTQVANYRFAASPTPVPTPLFADSFLQVEQVAHKANRTSKVAEDKNQSHVVSGANDVAANLTNPTAKSANNSLMEKENKANRTSKVAEDKNQSHVVSGANDVAANLTNPTAKSANSSLMEKENKANRTSKVAEDRNQSHVVSGANDVAANLTNPTATSANNSLMEKEKTLHEANSTSKVLTDTLHERALSGTSKVAGVKSSDAKSLNTTMKPLNEVRKAEKSVEKAIHMHHSKMEESTSAK